MHTPEGSATIISVGPDFLFLSKPKPQERGQPSQLPSPDSRFYFLDFTTILFLVRNPESSPGLVCISECDPGQGNHVGQSLCLGIFQKLPKVTLLPSPSY